MDPRRGGLKRVENWDENGDENVEKDQSSNIKKQNEKWRYEKEVHGWKNCDKIREGRLKWHGHCLRNEEDDPVKIGMTNGGRTMEEGRSRGRAKITWIETIVKDVRETTIDLDGMDWIESFGRGTKRTTYIVATRWFLKTKKRFPKCSLTLSWRHKTRITLSLANARRFYSSWEEFLQGNSSFKSRGPILLNRIVCY